MIRRKNLGTIACAACFILLCCFAQARAQQNSIAVSPASVDAQVKRGASHTQSFTLSNNTATRLRFRCSVGDVWYDASNARVTGRAGTLPRSASLWVRFLPAEIVVEPRSAATVKAVITVPLGASGGYYAMPEFEGMPVEDIPAIAAITAPGNPTTATASFGIRFRGLMMLTTEDTAEYNVEIMGGQIMPPTASSELGIGLDVHNRSTAHAGARGAFAILNEVGTLVGRGAIEEKKLLPGQRRTLRAGWAGELLPSGKYICVITLSYNRVGMDAASLVYELPFEVR